LVAVEMKRRISALIFLLGVVALGGFGRAEDLGLADYQPREGDVVFQSLAGGALADAIEGATQSRYSHCGIITKRADVWMVLEAIGPVKETPLAHWIMRGRNESFDVYRLKPQYSHTIPKFVARARAYEGRPYDMQYEFDDEEIYCSELVFSAFLESTGEQLGDVVSLGELQWKRYEDLIRGLAGGELPLERKMITPWHLSRAKQLELIYKSPPDGALPPPAGGRRQKASLESATQTAG
jgi:Permuted papain-like amidase enzyme, YaeF/YiiX, C92 family